MDIFFGVLIGLVILVFLVVIHELGHAIAARRNGVVVEEFGIGFPPKAWAKKLKNGILLSINWLPLGGFVKLQGENDSATGKGDYGAATFWQKTKILLAGVAINWLFAAFIFTILAWVGLPKIVDNQFHIAADGRVDSSNVTVAQTVDGGAADEAGINAGDEIIAIDGQAIQTTQDFIDTTRENAGEEVTLTYIRDDTERKTRANLGTDAEAGIFGAGLNQRETIHATWSAPIVGVATTAQLTWVTLEGLGDIIAKLSTGFIMQFSGDEGTREQASQNFDEVSSSVAGPVGILGVLFPSASQQGIGQLLLLTAIISMTLAIMNFLPIPALDGGRWFVTALFRIIRKPLTKDVEETIHGIGFLVLLGLIVLITITDIGNLTG